MRLPIPSNPLNALKSKTMSSLDRWDPAPHPIKLCEGETHVWRAYLDCDDQLVQKLHDTLAPDEVERAARFYFRNDRNHFVVARGVLRDLLGRYTGHLASEIRFDYARFGKPSLGHEFLINPLQFNVSHSHGLALLVFSLGRELGVDVELVRPDFGGDDVAQRYFAPREVEELQALPGALHAEGFFHCWTRKEAYIKAKGEGLQIPLKSFRVSLTPGAPVRLDATDSRDWSLHSLQPAPTYIGALAGKGQGWRLRFFDWQPPGPA